MKRDTSANSSQEPRQSPKVRFVSLYLIGPIFLIAGPFLMIMASLFGPVYVGFSGNVTGTIIASPENHPVVSYEVADDRYEVSLSEHGLGWAMGQRIELVYNPSDPGQASTAGSRASVLVWSTIGLGLLASGLLLTVRWLWRYHTYHWLIVHGQRVLATVVDTHQTLTNIGTYATTLICEWTSADNVIHKFTTLPVRLPKGLHSSDLPFTTLPVFFNPEKPRQYYVDDSEFIDYEKSRLQNRR